LNLHFGGAAHEAGFKPPLSDAETHSLPFSASGLRGGSGAGACAKQYRRRSLDNTQHSKLRQEIRVDVRGRLPSHGSLAAGGDGTPVANDVGVAHVLVAQGGPRRYRLRVMSVLQRPDRSEHGVRRQRGEHGHAATASSPLRCAGTSRAPAPLLGSAPTKQQTAHARTHVAQARGMPSHLPLDAPEIEPGHRHAGLQAVVRNSHG
jgi:hypothetical protein